MATYYRFILCRQHDLLTWHEEVDIQWSLSY